MLEMLIEKYRLKLSETTDYLNSLKESDPGKACVIVTLFIYSKIFEELTLLSKVTSIGPQRAMPKSVAAIDAEVRQIKAELSGLTSELIQEFVDKNE